MDRVAELESEVDTLRKRVEVTRHVAEDMSAFVSADPELVTLVVDAVLAHWTLVAPDRPLADVWRDYANRVEWDDGELGTMRPEMCIGRPESGPFDQQLYFERCWADHCETLQLGAMLRAA
jgi:hypothetical protein